MRQAMVNGLGPKATDLRETDGPASLAAMLSDTGANLQNAHAAMDQLEMAVNGPQPTCAGSGPTDKPAGLIGMADNNRASSAGLAVRLSDLLARIGG